MMSSRTRQPIGASGRAGLFGKPTSTRTVTAGRSSSEAPLLSSRTGNTSRESHQQIDQNQRQLASASATPYATLSPGRRPPFSEPYNGNPITPGRAEADFTSRPSYRERGIPQEESPNKSCRYTGHFRQTVISHPNDNSVMIKAVGALLVIGAITDPHRQQILRGHDMEISELAISLSGSLIATGQCGSTRRKGFPAPVVLWKYDKGTSLFVFEGLSQGVCHLSFSPDERFLIGCGLDRLVYVWDTITGELVTGKQYSEPATLGQWTAIKQNGRRPVYQFYLCVGNDVLALELTFDPSRRQWAISGGPMATPSSGLRRRYHCSTLLAGEKFLLCGTDVGDMVVFGIDAKVFRASVPVCSGGMLSICTDPMTGAVYCGGGNGVICKISGADMVWQQELETTVDGGVVSLSVQTDGCELLAGTQEGSVYRLILANLSASKVSSSQKSPILSVACGSRLDAFATCAQDGIVRVWDLCDFGVVAEAAERTRVAVGSALCICWLGEDAVVTGWSDCFVRCHNAATGLLRWEIPKAHRAPVTCCAARFDSSAAFLVTGAEDGSVSVWELRTRELLLQFSEHQRGVKAVLVDVSSPHLIHSVGADCTVLTYDLHKERRIVAHMTRTGSFQSMTQRLDSENELITCDVHGRLLAWDCDYQDPVQALQDPSQQCLSCVSISPSGRYMVLGGDDEAIKVLDLTNNWETVACGRAHAGAITSVQWTQDERQLVSAADDCTLAVWNFFGASPATPPKAHSNSGGVTQA